MYGQDGTLHFTDTGKSDGNTEREGWEIQEPVCVDYSRSKGEGEGFKAVGSKAAAHR